MILKMFSTKNMSKILAFFAQTTVTFCKNLIITLVLEKNANFFAENWQKSQNIVIITSTSGVGSEPGSSRYHLFSHFLGFTAEPQRLPRKTCL
jgi:hypothetical protein